VLWKELVGALGSRIGVTEAGFVLESVTGKRQREYSLEPDEVVDPSVLAALAKITERVESGEPLQHVLGRWGFRTLDLSVDARALIPRPETEIVVEHALIELDRTTFPAPPLVLDLGVGSGAIACALVAEHETVTVIGVDRSREALALAAENRTILGARAARVRLVASDWYTAIGPRLERRVAMIVANPPYLSEAEWRVAPATVREWDPRGALVGGPAGTEAYDAVIGGAGRFLVPGGSLVLEIGSTQSAAIAEIAAGSGASSCAIFPDLVGRDRVAVVSW
jgi:release factor glutamine methyltransferase